MIDEHLLDKKPRVRHYHCFERVVRIWRKRLYSVGVCCCGKVDDTSWRELPRAEEFAQ